jgi:hypothetical protein
MPQSSRGLRCFFIRQISKAFDFLSKLRTSPAVSVAVRHLIPFFSEIVERRRITMRFKWTSITESEHKRLLKCCNFTPIERQIYDLRRKGSTALMVAIKINYSESQIHRISAVIVEKIAKERNA